MCFQLPRVEASAISRALIPIHLSRFYPSLISALFFWATAGKGDANQRLSRKTASDQYTRFIGNHDSHPPWVANRLCEESVGQPSWGGHKGCPQL
jgi:hypothetical protein